MSGTPERSLPPTIFDVAKHAHVAASSVSRVLNDHPDVSLRMRERVLASADELGYKPDFLAKSLRLGTTYSVGFVVRDISNPLFADIAKGAEDALRRAGYSMVLTNSEGNPDLDAQYIALLGQRRVDALILAVESESHPATLDALHQFPGPLVLLDREVPDVTASAVLCDHRSGVKDAVSHLLALGHRRIGFVAGPMAIRVTRERLHGYIEAHEARATPIGDELLRLGAYTRDFGHAQTLALLDLDRPPTAILAAGIQLVAGVLLALQERRRIAGETIALVCCDEIDLMRVFTPPISAVTRDGYRLGECAADLLVDMLVRGAPARVEHLSTEYVARGTSVPPAEV
ncbi:MAG: LacI family DNA-binding transcriptional regulator [Chloroflexota bacterium]